MDKESRHPVYLSKNVVALITIYHRYDDLDDLWVADWPIYRQDPQVVADDAARQFIEQLEKHWTPCFLKALRKEIDKALGRE